MQAVVYVKQTAITELKAESVSLTAENTALRQRVQALESELAAKPNPPNQQRNVVAFPAASSHIPAPDATQPSAAAPAHSVDATRPASPPTSSSPPRRQHPVHEANSAMQTPMSQSELYTPASSSAYGVPLAVAPLSQPSASPPYGRKPVRRPPPRPPGAGAEPTAALVPTFGASATTSAPSGGVGTQSFGTTSASGTRAFTPSDSGAQTYTPSDYSASATRVQPQAYTPVDATNTPAATVAARRTSPPSRSSDLMKQMDELKRRIAAEGSRIDSKMGSKQYR